MTGCDDRVTFGKEFAELCRRYNDEKLSQPAIARAIWGEDTATHKQVHRILNGEVKRPSNQTIEAFQKVFRIPQYEIDALIARHSALESEEETEALRMLDAGNFAAAIRVFRQSQPKKDETNDDYAGRLLQYAKETYRGCQEFGFGFDDLAPLVGIAMQAGRGNDMLLAQAFVLSANTLMENEFAENRFAEGRSPLNAANLLVAIHSYKNALELLTDRSSREHRLLRINLAQAYSLRMQQSSSEEAATYGDIAERLLVGVMDECSAESETEIWADACLKCAQHFIGTVPRGLRAASEDPRRFLEYRAKAITCMDELLKHRAKLSEADVAAAIFTRASAYATNHPLLRDHFKDLESAFHDFSDVMTLAAGKPNLSALLEASIKNLGHVGERFGRSLRPVS